MKLSLGRAGPVDGCPDDPARPDGAASNSAAGGRIERDSGVEERIEGENRLISPRDAGQFEQFLLENRSKLLNGSVPFLESPFSGCSRPDAAVWPSEPSPGSALAVGGGGPGRRFSDPRMITALSLSGRRYLGMSPFQCPSLFTILAFLEYEYGLFHPAGGCGRSASGWRTSQPTWA